MPTSQVMSGGIQLVSTGIPVDMNDLLHITITTQVAGTTFTVDVRTLLPDGSVQVHRQGYTTTGGGTTDVFTLRLDTGFLIGAHVSLSSAPNTEADTYCVLSIRRGAVIANALFIPIVAGYVGLNHPLFWPGDDTIKPYEILGMPRVHTVANPAAGANLSTNIPTGTQLQIQSCRFRLVTDANVATRRVRLEFLSAANIIHQAVATNTQAASLTNDYNFSIDGAPQTLNASIHNIPIPSLWLDSGFTIRSQIDNIQVGDQISAIVYFGLRRGLIV